MSAPGNRQLRSKIIPSKQDISDSESEIDSNFDSLSEEETEPVRQRRSLPTYSPPLTPNNTYEIPVSGKPVVKNNFRQSTGHNKEIDSGDTDSERKPGDMKTERGLFRAEKIPREQDTKGGKSEKSKTCVIL